MKRLAVSMLPAQRAQRRSGTAAVEFAACGTAFVILIMGIFEMGRGFMVNHQLTNAARLGCRIAILDNKANSDVTSAVNANLSAQGINAASAKISIAVNGDSTKDVSSAQSQDNITVTIQIAGSAVSWVPLTKYITGNLSGSYTLRRE